MDEDDRVVIRVDDQQHSPANNNIQTTPRRVAIKRKRQIVDEH